MLKNYIDSKIYEAICKSFNFNDINEIRLRVNQKIIVSVGKKKYFLKDNNDYLVATKEIIDNFVRKASENSIYAYNDNIINGFITLPNGVRVGLAGFVVGDNEKVTTIKDFQSVNIRIPHNVKNCSLNTYEMLVDDQLKDNILVISKVGVGKTTFIRDFIYQLYSHNISQNVLVIDERNEITATLNGVPSLDIGCFADIYTNCSKSFALKNGIRSMSPDVVVTDEIDIERDIDGIKNAINSGVKVVATIHANDILDLKKKKGFDDILEHKYFTKYIVLTDSLGLGTVSNIYDENLKCIYCR